MERIKKSALSTSTIKEVTTLEETVNSIMSGQTALFLSISDKALLIDTRAWETRGVEKPETETVVRGPKESFGETLKVNTTLLRRKIKSPNLKLELLTLGKQTNTDVCIAYMGFNDALDWPGAKNRMKQRSPKSLMDAVTPMLTLARKRTGGAEKTVPCGKK